MHDARFSKVGAMKRRLRRRVFELLDPTSIETPLEWGLTGIIFSFIFVDISTMIIGTSDALGGIWQALFRLISSMSMTVFTLEYILRLWSAPEDRSRRFNRRTTGRLHYLITPMALVDLLALTPLACAIFLPGHTIIAYTSHIFVMLKLARYSSALRTLGDVIRAERRTVIAASFIMVSILISSATLMWGLECRAQPKAFNSIPNAMWWAVSTITTLGYGDIVPITPLGKILGGIVSIAGVSMISLPAAILATGFAREIGKQNFIVTFSIVSRVPLFADLDASRLTQITGLLKPLVVPARYVIIRRGETPEAVYFITAGEVEIDLPGGHTTLLHEGDFFGDVNLIDREAKRSRNVTATRPCRLLVLDLDDFDTLMEGWPDMREKVVDFARRHEQPEDPAVMAVKA